jgi:NADH:ubiquinone oxidoreductase subunit 6 (subunit J)
MKMFLQILLTLGLLAFIVGAILSVTGKSFVLTPRGYWHAAMALWMLLIATRAVYLDKK